MFGTDMKYVKESHQWEPRFLDDDLYKFNMQQFLLLTGWGDIPVEYQFTNRNLGMTFERFDVDHFHRLVTRLHGKGLSDAEASWMRQECPWFTPRYIEWLRGFRLDKSGINYEVKEGQLRLSVKGRWIDKILWECRLLSLISEVYYLEHAWRHSVNDELNEAQDRKDSHKFYEFGELGAQIIEFGTRRRFSQWHQERLVRRGRNYRCLVGTSNVWLAKEYGLKPVGTMAHELFMGAAAGKPLHGQPVAERYAEAYNEVLNQWYTIFKPYQLTVLPDTFGTDFFYKNISPSILHMYDGMRWDSGSAKEFTNLYNRHLQHQRIDPATKYINYSNNCNPKFVRTTMDDYFGGCKPTFGIGTNLTFDMVENERLGFRPKPLNMVIKLVEANETPTIKISDDRGKEMGPPEIIEKVLTAA